MCVPDQLASQCVQSAFGDKHLFLCSESCPRRYDAPDPSIFKRGHGSGKASCGDAAPPQIPRVTKPRNASSQVRTVDNKSGD